MNNKRQDEYSGSPSGTPAQLQGMIDLGESVYETCQHK